MLQWRHRFDCVIWLDTFSFGLWSEVKVDYLHPFFILIFAAIIPVCSGMKAGRKSSNWRRWFYRPRRTRRGRFANWPWPRSSSSSSRMPRRRTRSASSKTSRTACRTSTGSPRNPWNRATRTSSSMWLSWWRSVPNYSGRTFSPSSTLELSYAYFVPFIQFFQMSQKNIFEFF